MLDFSELTVVKNNNGLITALGYTVNSILLQNEKPLFVGGGKKKDKNDQEHDYDNLAVPAGLVCMTQTVCRRPLDELEANELEPTPYEENELVPDSLYERLMELAEVKEKKKMTKKHKPKPKSSTRKHKN